jgi:hypothetical protein
MPLSDDQQEDLFGDFKPNKQRKYDREQSDEARDASMEQVDEHADERWKDAAYETVIEVAQAKATFTADDVQMNLDKKPVHTHELRALGPIMLKAVRAGYIVQDGTFTRSVQVQCHSMPRRVWRSLIYTSRKEEP